MTKSSLITTTLLLLPVFCLGDPLNGGIPDGIHAFLFKVFGLFLPAAVLLVLFFRQLKTANPNVFIAIYALCAYLGYHSAKAVRFNLYLIDLRSDNTYLNGYFPDFHEEKSMIAGCLLGLVLIGFILFRTIAKNIQSFR
jgi:hypothetical protein